MRRAFANIGAEEGTSSIKHPAALAAAAAWVATLGRDLSSEIVVDPALVPEAPSYAWLNEAGVWAWYNNADAAGYAAEHGVPLRGAAPERTQEVHDKAFALRAARAAGLVPAPDVSHILDADSLSAGALAEILRAVGRDWPGAARGRFVLKPRFGTSGRGQISGHVDAPDLEALAGAASRLATRGGAILEPWFDRVADLSVQMFIGEDGAVTLLGSADLGVTPAGVYRSHSGRIDARGRPTSVRREDERAREAAVAIAISAAERGYWGPCGVDAFVFRGEAGEEHLRAIVEFNARFTMGTVALGSLRQRHSEVRAATGLAPGELRGFCFRLDGQTPLRAAAHFPLAGGASLSVAGDASIPE